MLIPLSAAVQLRWLDIDLSAARRLTWLDHFVPFDFAIPFHMMVAMIGGLLAIVHASCHIADYFHAVRLWADSDATASHMSCIQCAADSCTRPDKDIVSWFVWCRRVSQQTCGLQFIQRHHNHSRSGISCTTIQQAQVGTVHAQAICLRMLHCQQITPRPASLHTRGSC